jgi:hypothetical protein
MVNLQISPRFGRNQNLSNQQMWENYWLRKIGRIVVLLGRVVKCNLLGLPNMVPGSWCPAAACMSPKGDSAFARSRVELR